MTRTEGKRLTKEMPLPFVDGDEFEVRYPFVLEKVSLFDGEGFAEVDSWRPGTRGEMVGNEDAEMVADGIGTQVLRVISIHKPGKYPERIFFTQSWRDPHGRSFGKTKLRMLPTSTFRSRLRGFAHEFRLIEAAHTALKTGASE